ncbi:siphovirus Gp157 family protein [Jeotgalibaca porci]|uniref:siphovirus Gp157 family protein n=1 Tax=Jeotgalibaca porci TaxID=1868793 RepID=UPI0035A0C720
MKLYELTSSYQQVLEIAEQLDSETLKDTLDSINDAVEQKVENTAFVVKQLEANVSVIDEEIKRLQAMKGTQTNNIKSLKLYLQESMEKVGLDKVQGKLIKIAIQNNPQSVEVLNENVIPKNYFVEQKPKLDKKSILADLKSGAQVEGVEIKQTRSLRIR